MLFKKDIVVKILFGILILFMVLPFANKVNVFATAYDNLPKVKCEGNKELIKILNKFAIAGDSYAGYFIDFEDGKEYSFAGYAKAATTIEENMENIQKAMKSISPIVVLSIGVNDCEKETSLEKFASDLERVLKLASFYNKIVIMHTYMDYSGYNITPRLYHPTLYDQIIKLEADMSDRLYYIDMHDYENQYYQTDLLHYGKEFYDALYDRIANIIQILKA